MSLRTMLTVEVNADVNAASIDTKHHSPIALKNTINFLQSN